MGVSFFFVQEDLRSSSLIGWSLSRRGVSERERRLLLFLIPWYIILLCIIHTSKYNIIETVCVVFVVFESLLGRDDFSSKYADSSCSAFFF